MDLITALAISIGLLGAVATYLYLSLGLQIWIGFIGWASFYHCGGGTAGLQKSIICNLWGVFCGWIALILVQKVTVPLPGLLWPSIAVGIMAFVLVIGAKAKILDAIPAAVYGFASIAGYTLLTNANAMDFTMKGPLLCTIISIVVGALFGIVSQKFAGVMHKG